MTRLTDELDVSRVAALLRGQAVAIRAEVEAAADELCRWQPARAEWCINEVLGHLLEAERRGFNGRIRLMLAEDNPTLETWDQPAVASERRDGERDPRDLLGELEAIRADSVRLVEGLRPGDLERTGRHPQVGTLTVRDILHEWAHHDRNHLKQIYANVQAYVWPNMGNARRFSEPD